MPFPPEGHCCLEQYWNYKLEHQNQKDYRYQVQDDAYPGHLGNFYVPAGKYNGIGRRGHRQHKGTAAGNGNRDQEVEDGNVQP